MYARIEPSGCGEFHGNVKVRFAFYLEPSDVKYEHTYGQVPIIPPEGYPGEVDAMGSPFDIDDYNVWIKGLPKKWQLVPFHNHFVYVDPDVAEAELQSLMAFHLPNFYEAWKLDRIKGGMRRGWDVRHRVRPLRYEEVDKPEIFALRKAQCKQKAEALKTLSISVSSIGKGETFLATEIFIGATAIERDEFYSYAYTLIALDNPANGTGTIDTIEIWAETQMEGTKAGTFNGSGTDYTSRDVEVIGTVFVPSNQTPQSFTGLDCDVTSGDYIGCYNISGYIEKGSNGLVGVYYKSGDQFGAGEQPYSLLADDIMSLYGTGETAASGYSHNVIGVAAASIAEVNGVATASIAKVIGV